MSKPNKKQEILQGGIMEKPKVKEKGIPFNLEKEIEYADSSVVSKTLLNSLKPGTRDAFIWDTELPRFGVKITPTADRRVAPTAASVLRCSAAAAYLRQAHYPRGCYRFDVVEVVGTPEGGEPVVRHLEHAFPFEQRYRFPVA